MRQPLYTTVVAPPAERKSAVSEITMRPVFEYEHDVNISMQAEIDAYEVKRNVMAKVVKSLEDDAANNKKPGESIVKSGLALDKRRELSELEAKEPKPLRLWADDATVEALASLLADNGGRMAVVSAEGGLFEMLDGRYTKGVNMDVFLKGHPGDTLRVDRKGRPSEYIKAPALTVLLMIQPYVLDGLMSNRAFRGRGLTARFLYAIPTSRVGNRILETPLIPERVSKAYGGCVRDLLSIPLPEKETALELSPEAFNTSVDFGERLEPRLAGDLEDISDWAGKLHGAVLRIAGVLHTAQHRRDSGQVQITGATMRNAIAIGLYFLEHAKIAYTLMGADPVTANARYILRALEKGRYEEISRTDLTRLCRGRFKAASEMDAALGLLSDYGYLRAEGSDIGYNNRIRTTYKINPMAYGNDRFHGSDETADGINSISSISSNAHENDTPPTFEL